MPARAVRKDMLHNGSALDHLITALRGASSWEIFFGWVRLHVLFWLGVSPDRLAEIYRAQAPRWEIWEAPTNPPGLLLKRGANLGGLLTSYSIGTKIECRILPSTCCDRWPLFAPDCRDYPLRGGAGSAHRRGGRRPD